MDMVDGIIAAISFGWAFVFFGSMVVSTWRGEA